VSNKKWKVRNACCLSIFSYHKLAIYQDLEKNKELVSKHFFVQGLANGRNFEAPEIPASPEPKELDDKLHPRESYLILDADSSQLSCIEAVKSGANLLIQGPPGTGKSQTIANVVAEAIASGKRVLFVSEKMAALEVVMKRLKHARLDHYCLVLHSHNANKREVVKELDHCSKEIQKCHSIPTEKDFESLLRDRQRLNEYVRALHAIRQPMGKSAYQAMSIESNLHKTPFLHPKLKGAGALTAHFIENAAALARRLGAFWHIILEGERFLWAGCTVKAYTPQSRAQLAALLDKCLETLRSTQTLADALADEMETPTPSTLNEVFRLLTIVDFLGSSPGLEEGWLDAKDLDALRNAVERCEEIATSYTTLRAQVLNEYDDSFLDINPALKERLIAVEKRLFSLLGVEVLNNTALVACRKILFDSVKVLSKKIQHIERLGAELAEHLGISRSETLNAVKVSVRLAAIGLKEQKPLATWFDGKTLQEALEITVALKHLWERIFALEKELYRNYDEGILSLDCASLLLDYQTVCAKRLPWIYGKYHSVRKCVKRYRKPECRDSNPVSPLQIGKEIGLLQQEIHALKDESKRLLGPWYQARQTDFEGILKAQSYAKGMLSLLGPAIPEKLVSITSYGAICPEAVRKTGREVRNALMEWDSPFEKLMHILNVQDSLLIRTALEKQPISGLINWTNSLASGLNELEEILAYIEQKRRNNSKLTINSVLEDLGNLESMSKLEEELHERSEFIRKVAPSRWHGVSTDWKALGRAISWIRNLQRVMQEVTLTPAMRAIAVAPGDGMPDAAPLREAFDSAHHVMEELASYFDPNDSSAVLRLRKEVVSDVLLENFSVDDVPVQSIDKAISRLSGELDGLKDWIDYQHVCSEFGANGLGGLLEALKAHTEYEASQLPKIVTRCLYAAWLDWLYSQERCLGTFRAEDHEAVVKRFRKMDSALRDQGYLRVISEAESRKPAESTLGEMLILRKEANKKRGHKPIRRLLAEIRNLLFKIKPCLFMSPLSVSQYLDPEAIQFDLVVFDEASQVRPHEGIAAIYRGKQLVVCGDTKQLPPTPFFESELSEGYYDEENEDENPDEYESLLEVCATLGFKELYLRWHYRSLHENLIAFSNSQFYENKLVTFPAPQLDANELGVEFVHVPEGVYDRGGRRDNQIEAEKVVDVYLSLLKENPDRSFGIVAFSRAQSEAIENRLEHMVKIHPEVQPLIKTDLLEGIFVKNLENVQGDERDVIILSVGYAKDREGRMSMNFGPLNKPGGEKRLNVAITRARQKVVIVSSIESSDLDLSKSRADGVRQLYQYLDYAVRGPEALMSALPEHQGDYESDFEENVAAAIREMGYRVISQVGCSGYRIDIGVCLPDKPGSIILGVECDGAMYHSASTARDRDRLRQEVLERRGWIIHRIWSTEWNGRRETEIKKLRAAIEKASTAFFSKSKAPQIIRDGEKGVKVQRIPNKQPKDTASLEGVEVYRAVKLNLPRIDRHEILKPETQRILQSAILQIIQKEGPIIHIDLVIRRIVDALNIGQAGKRVQIAIVHAIKQLINAKMIIQKGGEWLQQSNAETPIKVRRPDPAYPKMRREIQHIPSEEIELAMILIMRVAFSLTEEELIVQTARLYGFQRIGNNINTRLTGTLDGMVRDSKLAIEAGKVVLPERT
jgi:very-short-patch-repair endonuclease/DNA polymerase III delta prime subunit